MRVFLCVVVLFWSGVSFAKSVKPLPKRVDVDVLLGYLSGSFNSTEQSRKVKGYFDISLAMVRVWKGDKKSRWLYVEQAVTKRLSRPYRQRVYQLRQVGPNRFTSTIYKVTIAKQLAGKAHNPKVLIQLKRKHLRLLKGCAIYLTYRGGKFRGSTKKRECTNRWRGASYATSEVVITPQSLYSWDRGWNSKGKQIWGARKGGYMFRRVKK